MENQLEIFDIYDLWYVPVWQRTWVVSAAVICLVLLFMAIGFLAYRWGINRYHRVIPVDQDVVRKIGRLDPMSFDHEDRYPIYYQHLTNELKRYLQYKYQAYLQSKTDVELIAFLQQKGIAVSVREPLNRILQGAQRIKFARASVRHEQMVHDRQELLTIITFLSSSGASSAVSLDSHDTLSK